MTGSAVVTLIFVISGIIVSVKDILTMRISLMVNYTSVLVIFLLCSFYNMNIKNIYIGLIYNLILYLFVYYVTGRGIGLGDVQFSVLCGMYSGFPEVLIASLLSSYAGILFFFILAVNKKKVHKIPYGPFMFTGALIAHFTNFRIY